MGPELRPISNEKNVTFAPTHKKRKEEMSRVSSQNTATPPATVPLIKPAWTVVRDFKEAHLEKHPPKQTKTHQHGYFLSPCTREETDNTKKHRERAVLLAERLVFLRG